MTVIIGRVYIQGTDVNVREGPSTAYRIKYKINKTDTFLIAQIHNQWLKLEGFQGWIYYNPSYITFLQDADSIKPLSAVTVKGMGINVRMGPSTTDKVVYQVNKTDPVTQHNVYKIYQGWLNIGGEYWIYYDPSYMDY